MAAKSVLTYIADADDADEASNTVAGIERQEYARSKKLLKEMVGRAAETGQLVMFITGPGGSGKSEIINELLAYAQEYCANIQQPFTRRTILITACSGVAATLIHGETVHSALFLNKDFKNIESDEKALFQNCVRLVVVDEISMLSASDLKKLSDTMNWLMDKRIGAYGGVDIAFMGDFCQLPPVGKATRTIYDTRA